MKKFRVFVDGVKYEVEVEEISESRGSAKAPSFTGKPGVLPQSPIAANQMTAIGNTGVIKAPMPGAILEVRVEEGEEVALGQVLCILEAMKMENEVLADKAGIVKEVRVSQGQSVGAGEIMIIIE